MYVCIYALLRGLSTLGRKYLMPFTLNAKLF